MFRAVLRVARGRRRLCLVALRLGRFRFGLRFASFLLRARVLVVGNVEARALENQPCARAEQPLERELVALRAFLERLLAHRLEVLEVVAAFLAGILVSRHEGERRGYEE